MQAFESAGRAQGGPFFVSQEHSQMRCSLPTAQQKQQAGCTLKGFLFPPPLFLLCFCLPTTPSTVDLFSDGCLEKLDIMASNICFVLAGWGMLGQDFYCLEPVVVELTWGWPAPRRLVRWWTDGSEADLVLVLTSPAWTPGRHSERRRF